MEKWKLGWMAVAVLMSVNFLACKDEDKDEKSGLKPTSLGIAQIKSYKKIGEGGSTVEQFKLDYTANGTIAAMESDTYTLSQNPLEIKYIWADYEQTITQTYSDFTLNHSGCATAFTMNSINEYNGETKETNCLYTLKYNSEKQLLESTGNASGFYDKKILTWDDGNLVKAESFRYSTSDNNEKCTLHIVYEYEYTSNINNGIFMTDIFNLVGFAHLGLVGVTTKKLPKNMIYTKYDVSKEEETIDYTDKTEYTYEFDDLGRVISAKGTIGRYSQTELYTY